MRLRRQEKKNIRWGIVDLKHVPRGGKAISWKVGGYRESGGDTAFEPVPFAEQKKRPN